MTILTLKGDLFTAPKDYYLVHCVSSDFALGAGIAKQFTQRMDMRNKLKDQYKHMWCMDTTIGKALLVDNVFNLVTKLLYWHKPTYDTLESSLKDLKEQCLELNIKHLAMPTLGCGLDKLKWNVVKQMINDIFENTDIDIIVYTL